MLVWPEVRFLLCDRPLVQSSFGLLVWHTLWLLSSQKEGEGPMGQRQGLEASELRGRTVFPGGGRGVDAGEDMSSAQRASQC